MNVEIIDEIGSAESGKVCKMLEEVASFAAKEELKDDKFEITVTLTDNESIRSLNKEFRQVDSATDVLSFPLWDRSEEPSLNPENGCIMLGDIVISLERACEQASEYGHSVRRECAYLCVHGVMHLLGYDHMQEDEKKIMRLHEEEVLKKLNLTRED